MKGLLTIHNNKKNAPKEIKKIHSNTRKRNHRLDIFSATTKPIVYIINNYVFCMSEQSWASYQQICYGTIRNRVVKERSPAEVLGFKKIILGKYGDVRPSKR